ncbi:MAG: glycosyltransferase family 2 protein [Desulfuromonadaceae bacterium]|nr:glycosyltransferase family 2 protein [Desulfuromonadaceae bacterium]
MANITAVINTYNEEKNIEQCLESLKWCHEIIVVDMNSDDETRTIARRYTEKIFLFQSVGYVEPARKFAVEKATGDWVLIVDADELIPASLKEQILFKIEKNDVDVVYLPRKNYIMGELIKYSGWWPDYQLRLFKKDTVNFTDQIHAGIRIEKNARECFLSDEEKNGIEHFSYFDAEHFIKKLNAYTSVEAKHLYDDRVQFSFKSLFESSLREFYNRYIKSKGYKDGYRGFFLCLMMLFYRALISIKLWEKYENKDSSVSSKYNEQKKRILKEYAN